MLTTLLLAAVVAAPAPAAATVPADLVPLPFAVCVTLTSDPTHPHLDSFWNEDQREEARARRREIVREGWVRLNAQDPSEEDESGPLTILRATVEDTRDGGSICVEELATEAGPASVRSQIPAAGPARPGLRPTIPRHGEAGSRSHP